MPIWSTHGLWWAHTSASLLTGFWFDSFRWRRETTISNSFKLQSPFKIMFFWYTCCRHHLHKNNIKREKWDNVKHSLISLYDLYGEYDMRLLIKPRHRQSVTHNCFFIWEKKKKIRKNHVSEKKHSFARLNSSSYEYECYELMSELSIPFCVFESSRIYTYSIKTQTPNANLISFSSVRVLLINLTYFY